MTTPLQQKIRDKTITPQQWADMVKSGDWICLGGAGADGVACPDALADRLGDGPGMVKDIEIWSYGHFNPMRFHSVDREERYHLHHEGFFFPWGRHQRDASGTLDHIPWEWSLGLWQSYYRFFDKEKSKRRMDWTVISCSPPEGGYFNFSYSTGGAMVWAQSAKKLVLEVRQDYAWAEGGANNLIHIDDVDYIVEVDMDKYPFPQHDEAEPGEAECQIAENILEIMQDGDCIQLGIGGLPTAVARAISECGLRHLGIHTEMLQEGLMSLIESGAVDNSRKAIDTGRSVWGFALPLHVDRYHDFVHHNRDLAVYDVNYTNNLKQLSQIDNMVAIDNFLAIDLQGRLSASYYDTRPISGTGGFFQFVVFCALSKGGRSIATATSTNHVNGKLVSRVVPTLPGGSGVDVPEHLVSWVATEYGMVNMWGLSSYERAKALISIAHPDFRDELEREAHRLNLTPKHFPVSMHGPGRRYPDYNERRDFKLPYTDDWRYFDYNI